MMKFWVQKRNKIYKQSAALVIASALLFSTLVPPFAEAKRYASNMERHQLRQMSVTMKSKAEQQAIRDTYDIPSPHHSILQLSLGIPAYLRTIADKKIVEFLSKLNALFKIILTSVVECYYWVEDILYWFNDSSLEYIRKYILKKPASIPIRQEDSYHRRTPSHSPFRQTVVYSNFPMSGKSDGGSQSEQPFNDGEREPNKLRILLVDDSKGLRFVISNFLSRCGYEVVEAEDGEDGLEKLDAMGPFDLIITDMEMPKMGGQKLIETVALRKNSPKMILQSGNYEGEEIAKKLDVPFYLKGEDMDLLLQTIKKLMDSSPKKYTEDGTTPQASIREDTLSSGGSAVEKKLRILLVEDTESMRYIISCDLSESGFEVVEAENGKVALDKLETMEPFDLVITDNRMPWMNGLELIEILSSWKSPPKIILMSAGSSDKDIARRLAIPYFDKETSLEKFMQMIIDLTNPGETNIENGGNWVWLYELLKYTFFPKLTQKEYNDKWALLEDVISYIGMGLLAYHLALLLPGSNSVVAELVAYFHGIFITMLGHRKLISHFFVSRAPPLHLKTAETISWISFFAGVLGIIFPALMPIIFTVPFITHWIINNRSDSNSLAESASTEETMGIIQKHTEPTLLYQLAYHGAKTFLSMSRILDKEPVVVVQLDRFVKIKGEDIHVPKAFETVLQGIVDAVKEEKGTIAFVSESNRREEIIKTLLSKVEHREAASKLQYFFAEDSEKMKDTIRRKNLSISFVLTLFPDQWKGYTRLTLGKLLAGLINGFEMRVEGEFREALEAMIQEFGWMENGSIIHRDGQLILQQKYLKPELAEHLWKEQVYRLSA